MAQVRIKRRKQKIIAFMIVYEITGGDNCAETGFLDRLSLLSPQPRSRPIADQRSEIKVEPCTLAEAILILVSSRSGPTH